MVTIIGNKGEFEAWRGYLDICTVGCLTCTETTSCGHNHCGRRCVTLPREVETVLAANINGNPALGMGELFNFHLNGPGDNCPSCSWTWQDLGQHHSTYRDLVTPAKLVAYLQTPEDNGTKLIVYGYDSAGNKLRRNVAGEWLDGWQVVTVYGVALPDAEAPTIARITGVFKDESVGTIRLSTIDDSGLTGVTLGVYEPDERLPQYRRIKLNRACNWIRIAYRKSTPIFRSRWDHVPLKSRVAFLLGMQARKHYADMQIGDAHAYEADAARLEIEAQLSAESPTLSPIQVVDRASSLRDKSDWVD